MKSFFKQQQLALMAGLIASGGVLLLRLIGTFQLLELRAFDGLLRLRPPEPLDQRIVIVGITEADLNWLQTSVVTDQMMADLIQRIKLQSPRSIGLDFYRNQPIESGYQALREVFRNTPNLIGIEKVVDDGLATTLPGNDILSAADQVAASDIAVDADGRVRRALLFPSTAGPRVLEGLGLRLALDYLSQDGIMPVPQSRTLMLESVSFPALKAYDGGYVRVDDGGYQILLDSQNAAKRFQQVSLREVMTDATPPELLKDRIVLIGSAAISSSDIFFTAYSSAAGAQSQPTYGVALHAMLTSQILSTVLDGRPMLRVLPKWVEIMGIVLVAYLGVGIKLLPLATLKKGMLQAGVAILIVGGGYALLCVGGWWLPVVPLMTAFVAAAMLTGFYQTAHLKTLSAEDKLTGLANRRTFDETLQREWYRMLRSQRPLSLIICDVDYFKRYNDTYGHLAGDHCLSQVGKALKAATKHANVLVARYGGEEFVILLPEVDSHEALSLAERIRQQVQSLQLPHTGSQVSAYVSLSLGVTSVIPTMELPPSALVETADQGLYQAKQSGRNRATLNLSGSAADNPADACTESSLQAAIKIGRLKNKVAAKALQQAPGEDIPTNSPTAK
jgi:diguanylate cyclase (GGDEF)-like protein